MSTEIEFVPDPSATINRPGMAWSAGFAQPVLLDPNQILAVTGGAGFTPFVINIAALRLVDTPTTTQYMYVQGDLIAGDGGGGIYYFDPTSMAVDDGDSVVMPTATDPSDPGRWLKYI